MFLFGENYDWRIGYPACGKTSHLVASIKGPSLKRLDSRWHSLPQVEPNTSRAVLNFDTSRGLRKARLQLRLKIVAEIMTKRRQCAHPCASHGSLGIAVRCGFPNMRQKWLGYAGISCWSWSAQECYLALIDSYLYVNHLCHTEFYMAHLPGHCHDSAGQLVVLASPPVTLTAPSSLVGLVSLVTYISAFLKLEAWQQPNATCHKFDVPKSG